jgi:hypothetical protein
MPIPNGCCSTHTAAQRPRATPALAGLARVLPGGSGTFSSILAQLGRPGALTFRPVSRVSISELLGIFSVGQSCARFLHCEQPLMKRIALTWHDRSKLLSIFKSLFEVGWEV